MKVLASDNGEYTLEFSDIQEFEAFFEKADAIGFFHLPLKNISSGTIFRATATGNPRSRKIRPMRIVQEGVQSKIVLAELPEQPPERVVSESESALVENPEADSSLEQPGEKQPRTLAEEIRAMTVTEKTLLAMRANAAERRVLMRDLNPKIQEFLLRNPRLTEPEVAFMAKNPGSSIPTLLTIIQHKQWMIADSVRQGILTNPKTPPHIIFDRIPYLSPADLIKMHYATSLREDIRDAVHRQMKKKGIRIPN